VLNALEEYLKVLYPNGGYMWHDRPHVATEPPSWELGRFPMKLDRSFCMHQLFPGRKPSTKSNGFRRGAYEKGKKNACHAEHSRLLTDPRDNSKETISSEAKMVQIFV